MTPATPLVRFPLPLRIPSQKEDHQHQRNSDQKSRNQTRLKQRLNGRTTGHTVHHIQQPRRNQRSHYRHRSNKAGRERIFIPVLTHLRINGGAKQRHLSVGHS